MNQVYSDDEVLVYGIYSFEEPEKIEDFIDQTGVTYPLVADEGTLGLLAFPQGVGYPYPRDVVIGKDLTIHSIRNSFNVDEMTQLINTLLDE